MARRGEDVREHLLLTAKDLFLESGFERTSMDAIAARAHSSKQTLYAHFTTKDALFRAVVGRMGEIFEACLRDPGHYAAVPSEAAVLFCGRFIQLLHWAPILRTWRTVVAEVERDPAVAAELSSTFYDSTTTRLAEFLRMELGLSETTASRAAVDLLSVGTYPVLPHLLAGVGTLRDDLPDETRIELDVDLTRVRRELMNIVALETVG